MNYLKKWVRIICCILIIFTFSGCWSKNEPKTLEMLDSIIYDIEDNGKYKVISEIKNSLTDSSKSSGGSKSNTVIISGEGDSLLEAVRQRTESFEKKIFASHLKIRFFTERFVRKEDMSSALDSFARDLLYETPFMVVIKSENPDMLYNCKIGLSDSAGSFIDSLSRSQPAAIAESVFVTTLDFIKDYYNEGKQPVMGVAEIVKDDSITSQTSGSSNGQDAQSSSSKKYKVNYEGLAAFKDDKFVGYMNGIETRAYNIITNKLKTAYISFPIEDNIIISKIKSSKSDIKTDVKGNNITINIKIKMNLDVVGVSGTTDVSKAENLKKVEESFNKQMQSEIMPAIKKAQTEFKCDIFGFGSYVHAEHPEKWKEIKDNWDDYFSKATVNVAVESSVTRSGEIKEPFKVED